MPRITPIKRSLFETFLKMIGCTLKRTKGDHLIYTRPGLKRPIVITRSNLRTLSMSSEEYLSIIKQL